MPSYAPALSLLPPLLLVIFFAPQTSLARNVWVLEKKMLSLGLSNLFGLAAVAGGLYLVHHTGRPSLSGVALAVLSGYGAYNLYVMILAGSRLWPARGVLGAIAASYGGMLYTAGVMLGVVWLDLEPGAGWPGLAALLKALGLAWLVTIPLAVGCLLAVAGRPALFSRLSLRERWHLIKERIGAGGV